MAQNEEKLHKFMVAAFHLVGCVQFWFSVYYDWNHVRIPRDVSPMGSGFGGKLKFLTFWDAVIQAVYFTICILSDFQQRNGNEPRMIHKIKDYIFASVAFPVAMFVGVTFWALMFVDRELVFPKALDPYFPTWLNHVMHTNIMVFILVDMFISYHAYPKRSRGLTGLSLFMLVYLVWTHIIYYKGGIWTYPVLDVLNWWQRIIFFAFSLLLVQMLYIFGSILNKVAWGERKEEVPAMKRNIRSSNKRD